MTGFFALTATCVGLLLVAEAGGRPLLRAVSKCGASLGFVGVGVLAGTAGLDGRARLVALVLCLVGDLCLLSKHSRMFLAGLGAFLLGHLAFAVAFASRGLSSIVTLVAAAVLMLLCARVLKWLVPHVAPAMRGPVVAYALVITAMVATAIGAVAAGAPALLAVGAAMFYASDLAVARDRFVAPGFVNCLWGLPLYYGAVLLLASR